MSPALLRLKFLQETAKRYKLPGKDQIPEILVQAGCKTLLRSINLLILLGNTRTTTAVVNSAMAIAMQRS
jgi:hypothetical protein